MITGKVNPAMEATIPVQVIGAQGQSLDVTVVIDTGYNGGLSLPMAIVDALSLPQAASREVTLGDASRKVFAFYNAAVLWDGQRRKVRVLCVEGDPLLGTALLRGYKLAACRRKAGFGQIYVKLSYF